MRTESKVRVVVVGSADRQIEGLLRDGARVSSGRSMTSRPWDARARRNRT
jgi:hypothetical protein